jgi:hypothetical protein
MILSQLGGSRLLLLRFSGRIAQEEVKQFVEDSRRAVSGYMERGLKTVACVDMRDSTVLTPDEFQVVGQMLRSTNVHIEANGLCCRSPTLILQMQRLLREANHPGRRVFATAQETAQYLGTYTSKADLKVIEAFLEHH